MITNEAYAAAVEQQSKIAGELARSNALNEQLVAALHALEVSANTAAYCYDKRPENFAVALADLQASAATARAALAAAEAA